jgi:hypothetical protein
MKVRQLDSNNDYQIGLFLKDTPETVAQAVISRLSLWQGEWFLDTTEGTPYLQSIVGFSTNYDIDIQERILNTKGVRGLLNYTSEITNRVLNVTFTLDTIYGISSQQSTTLG